MQTAAGVVGVRAFAAAASARLGRTIAPSTITRAVQSGAIPATRGPRGPLIDLSAGLAAYLANTDPVKAAATAERDGRVYDLDLLSYDAPTPTPTSSSSSSSSSSMRSIKEESAALALERQKIEMAKLRGEIARVAETRTAFAKVFGLVVEQIGLGLADAAAALQEEHGVEAAAAARTLRGWWRQQRGAVAKAAATTARATPLLSDVTFGPDDEAQNAAGQPGTACLGGDRGDFHAAAAN